MTDARGWFGSCGKCGGEGAVINAAIVRSKTCPQCENFGMEDEGAPYVMDSLVCTEVGWCACGNPEDVDRMMLAYLESLAHPEWPYGPPAEGVSPDAERLLAYVADSLEWTEHGGSVGGAWLTDAGKVALANLRAATRGQPASAPPSPG